MRLYLAIVNSSVLFPTVTWAHWYILVQHTMCEVLFSRYNLLVQREDLSYVICIARYVVNLPMFKRLLNKIFLMQLL